MQELSMVGGETRCVHAKVAWASVCHPLESGGLDFREVLAWNKTLIFQRLCDTATRDSLWHDWVAAYKLGSRNVWTVEPRASDSAQWRRTLAIRDEVKSCLGLIVCEHLAAMTKPARMQSVYAGFHPPAPIVPWASLVWSPFHPSRVSFIAWLAC